MLNNDYIEPLINVVEDSLDELESKGELENEEVIYQRYSKPIKAQFIETF